MLLGVLAAIGTAVHGAFDLAVAANPPARGRGGFPNAVDPRGFLTFAVAAVALAVISRLMLRAARSPRGWPGSGSPTRPC